MTVKKKIATANTLKWQGHSRAFFFFQDKKVHIHRIRTDISLYSAALSANQSTILFFHTKSIPAIS